MNFLGSVTTNYVLVIICRHYILYMKPSQQQKIRMYSHHDHDLDVEDEFWPIMGILLAILGVWTTLIHWIDWATLDVIPWWA